MCVCLSSSVSRRRRRRDESELISQASSRAKSSWVIDVRASERASERAGRDPPLPQTSFRNRTFSRRFHSSRARFHFFDLCSLSLFAALTLPVSIDYMNSNYTTQLIREEEKCFEERTTARMSEWKRMWGKKCVCAIECGGETGLCAVPPKNCSPAAHDTKISGAALARAARSFFLLPNCAARYGASSW